MPEFKPTKAEETIVDALVDHYQANTDTLQRLMHQVRLLLSNNPRLQDHVHSIKWRLKDPTHLRDKLFRKIDESKKKGKAFGVTKDNLFIKINDLVGFRILHLYTKEVDQIDSALRELPS
jgi:putative GTP pyrophosphokinase